MGLKGDFRIIATGTPIENHLGELWNLFNFINPGLLGSREYFNGKFAQPIEGENDSEARAGLKKLISPFILRRLKRDVLSELPPRTDITLHVDLSDEETALYEALRLEAVNQMKEGDMMPGQQRIRALASITRLRRAVCNPNMVLGGGNMPSAKLEVLGGVLDELLENNHRALVFSQFVDHLSLIRDYLGKRGISYQYLDGATPAKKRTEAVHAFQAGLGELFLISLRAGGIGLNLTAADYVIHMDPWWNPAVEDQASDRAHRIGQLRPVTVYRLVANNTIEEKIVKLHAQKRDLADSLLEGSEISAKMSLDDVLALLD
jgi:SNF2 family DNA or RNA helicase